MKKISLILIAGICIAGSICFFDFMDSERISYDDRLIGKEPTNFEKKHLMMPEERYQIRQMLTYRTDGPNYVPGYQQKELKKVLTVRNHSTARTSSVEMVERGPSNVPGRARGLVVLPQDATHKTWLVGSSGGGIWKTIDGGNSWTDMSMDFPTLAVSTLAFCESQPNVIYAGTGEYIASAYTAINGDGIFKSTDAGETWTHLASTSGSELWQSVTRVIVHPVDPNIVLASTAPNTWGDFSSNIMKSVDGGVSWTSVIEVSSGAIEQIIASPEFGRIYAAQSGVGVLISEDNGDTWTLKSEGMDPSSRIELAISPVNPSRMYASVVGGRDTSQEADIYYSDDAGDSWTIITDEQETIDVLGGQGWYDNTILAHPFNLDEFYIGGIGIYKYALDLEAGVTEGDPQFLGVETGGTETFMSRINFGAEFDGGTVAPGSAPEDKFTTVEIRFGPGKFQKAHRFTVPEGRGAAVPDSEYTYEDYIDVPFQVWDVDSDPPRQLMVSFRDQQRDGSFNLIHNYTDGGENDPDHLHSREYIFINSKTYAETPSAAITVAGGHVDEDLFFIWPYLTENAVWKAEDLPEATFKINWGTLISGKYTVTSIADPYGDFDDKNDNVHPDHHNLVSVIHNEAEKEWQIVEVNDGASYASDIAINPGFSEGSWSFAGSTMNTTQFYGADKAPGVDRYVGGAQDNGSWFSPAGEDAVKTTQWVEAWGGDGFDAVWHPTDINKLIVTSQNLGIGRSVDGGGSFTSGAKGLAGDSSPPFIGQFANAIQRPDVVFTVGGDGVYKSTSFAEEWELVDLTSYNEWVASSFISIEISDASPDVVWAGTGVLGDNGSIFVSTDKGETFRPVPDNGLNAGLITGIGTHPTDHETVFVLFSYAESPKVLKSTDLGQTWEDISGYSAGSTSTGFPDVAVYDLQVMPHDPNTIWVGSEIGIVESNDGGATWHLLDSNMPHASIWKIRLKEDQLVLASHARGIWTYQLPEIPVVTYYPEITEVLVGMSEIGISFDLISTFDSVRVFVDDVYAGTILDPVTGKNIWMVPKGSETSIKTYVKAYKGKTPFTSETEGTTLFAYPDAQDLYVDRFVTNDGNFLGEFIILKVHGFENGAIQSHHGYEASRDYTYQLKFPITISTPNAFFSYMDVVIVEPADPGANFGSAEFRDYVVVEGSLDGIHWLPLGEGYDAGFNDDWLSLYNEGKAGTSDHFVQHEINLLEYYNPGDEVLFRFRLHSDEQNTAWGWAIDDVSIQGEVLGTSIMKTGVGIYPNPVGNTLYLTQVNEDLDQVVFLDMMGRKVKEFSVLDDNILDVSDLTAGVYIISFYYSNGRSEALKVIKQ